MKINILFFASLREAAGVPSMEVEVGPGTTVSELWQQLSASFELAPAKVLCAVNQEYVDSDYAFTEGDHEVAFFPPVTGG